MFDIKYLAQDEIFLFFLLCFLTCLDLLLQGTRIRRSQINEKWWGRQFDQLFFCNFNELFSTELASTVNIFNVYDTKCVRHSFLTNGFIFVVCYWNLLTYFFLFSAEPAEMKFTILLLNKFYNLSYAHNNTFFKSAFRIELSISAIPTILLFFYFLSYILKIV